MINPIKYIWQRIYRFFLWSSGADIEILDRVPHEKNKYFGIGGTIIFTAAMASFAGGYAFFTAFKDPNLAVFFGAFWGALIFNLDRYIVSTFGVGDGKKTISRQEVVEGAPRIIMAIVLGIVIATPLELKLFEGEIDAEISRQNLVTGQRIAAGTMNTIDNTNQNFSDEIAMLREQINIRKNDLNEKKIKRDKAYEKYMCELNGTCGTGIPGQGPVFREAKNMYLQLDSEYQSEFQTVSEENRQDSERIRQLGGQIDNNINNGQQEIAILETAYDSRNGLLARIQALSTLTDKDSSLLMAKWLITLLFILIEIAPILFKMMTERGSYDDILDNIKHEVKVQQLMAQSSLNEDINTSVKVHSDKNAQKLATELASNKKLLESISQAQAEIAQVAIDTWKKEEIKKAKSNPSNIIKKRK